MSLAFGCVKKTSANTARFAWQSPDSAADYRRSRQPSAFRRYRREEEILTGWLRELPAGGIVLDVPCGAGRFVGTVAQCGLRYIGADVSAAMIREARRDSQPGSTLGFFGAAAEQIPLADSSVHCVIIWRLLHHVRDAALRQAMLREAARVTRRLVLVSFHHSLSFTAIRKRLSGHSSGAITHWRLQREAEACGLRVVDLKSFRKFVSINWFACLVKTGA